MCFGYHSASWPLVKEAIVRENFSPTSVNTDSFPFIKLSQFTISLNNFSKPLGFHLTCIPIIRYSYTSLLNRTRDTGTVWDGGKPNYLQ